jgi:hypothetical protein
MAETTRQERHMPESRELSEREELPELDDAAAIYGSGDAVTGVPCIIIAVVIFTQRPS